MRRRALLSIAGVVASSGCGGHLGNDPTNVTTLTHSKKTTTIRNGSPLEVIAHDLARLNEGSKDELATVTGTVRNPTDETITEATVTATFKDAHGAVLERTSASASDLSPGESWTFQLVHPAAGEEAHDVADYEIVVNVTD